MSINAINSISLYEYYYTLNPEEKKKKSSVIEKEMRKYNLTPTDDETLNIALLSKAKKAANTRTSEEKNDIPYSARPWADLMYQLNLTFNEDPKDDIKDIKAGLKDLMQGFDDEELQKEVSDLEDYVQRLYLSFQKNFSTSFYDGAALMGAQMENISIINRANLGL